MPELVHGEFIWHGCGGTWGYKCSEPPVTEVRKRKVRLGWVWGKRLQIHWGLLLTHTVCIKFNYRFYLSPVWACGYSFGWLIYISNSFFTLVFFQFQSVFWYRISEKGIFMAEYASSVHLTQGFLAVMCQLLLSLNIDRKWRLFHPGVLYGRVQPIWADEISYHLIMMAVPIIIIGPGQGQRVRLCWTASRSNCMYLLLWRKKKDVYPAKRPSVKLS